MASSQLPRMRPKIGNQPRQKARSVSVTAATIQNAASSGVPGEGRLVQARIGQLDRESEHGAEDQRGGAARARCASAR